MSEISGGNGRTILFVSHNLAAMRVLCSRAILLDHGGLICDGPVDQVIADYLEKFGGEGGEVRWDADAAACSEEFGFVFRRAWVENRLGAVASNLALDQPFTICVEYQVESYLPSLTIGFFMQNSQGVGVCGSNDAGIPRASDRVTGLYVSRCRFLHVYSMRTHTISSSARAPIAANRLSIFPCGRRFRLVFLSMIWKDMMADVTSCLASYARRSNGRSNRSMGAVLKRRHQIQSEK